MYLISIMLSLLVTFLILRDGGLLMISSLPLFIAPLVNDLYPLTTSDDFIFFAGQTFLGLLPIMYFLSMDECELQLEDCVHVLILSLIVLLNCVYGGLFLLSSWDINIYTSLAEVLWVAITINIIRRGLKHGTIRDHKAMVGLWLSSKFCYSTYSSSMVKS